MIAYLLIFALGVLAGALFRAALGIDEHRSFKLIKACLIELVINIEKSDNKEQWGMHMIDCINKIFILMGIDVQFQHGTKEG